jgi:hypothetical protein
VTALRRSGGSVTRPWRVHTRGAIANANSPRGPCRTVRITRDPRWGIDRSNLAQIMANRTGHANRPRCRRRRRTVIGRGRDSWPGASPARPGSGCKPRPRGGIRHPRRRAKRPSAKRRDPRAEATGQGFCQGFLVARGGRGSPPGHSAEGPGEGRNTGLWRDGPRGIVPRPVRRAPAPRGWGRKKAGNRSHHLKTMASARPSGPSGGGGGRISIGLNEICTAMAWRIRVG